MLVYFPDKSNLVKMENEKVLLRVALANYAHENHDNTNCVVFMQRLLGLVGESNMMVTANQLAFIKTLLNFTANESVSGRAECERLQKMLTVIANLETINSCPTRVVHI